MPEIPQTRTNNQHQNPIALCKSQLSRGNCASQFTVVLRRQFLLPGHQTMPPVSESKVTKHEPMPFTRRPVLPPRRLSCKSASHSTMRPVEDCGSPRSEPVYGS